MKRIYHRYEKWEDYQNGMYSTKKPVDDEIELSKKLLKDPIQLKKAMEYVAFNWNYSAEENLTDISKNRRAWLGQAACCYSHGASDQTTKIAWRNLFQEERDIANNVADIIIKKWETSKTDFYEQQELPF